MELKGAELKNFYTITDDIPGQNDTPEFPKLVKIPHYQRPYKWTKDNIIKLIDDWFSEEGNSYFSGSIVTVNNSRFDAHELIDGQQRFTTIYLANYIRFLLCRVTIRQAIQENKVVNINSILDSFIQSARFLLISDDLKIELSELKNCVLSPFESGDDIDVDALISSYCSKVFLPEMIEQEEGYAAEHNKGLKLYLEGKKLALSYDRSSFNISLMNAVSKCHFTISNQSFPKLHIDKKDMPINELKYADALFAIFDSFDEKVNSKSPFGKAKSVIDLIGRFLNEIKVCVVQTGNARDAYTLFEVLNDRSLALDDLDLIKNQFYKTYVLNNEELADEDIDELLQDLDNQWVDEIFTSQPDSAKKLITYLASVYITGSDKILYNKGEGYREAISYYLDHRSSYDKEDIKRDFNIFQACKALLVGVGVGYRSTDIKAIKSEYSSDSQFAKTVHFLIAMKQEGVLSGLVSFVLKYIQSEVHDGKCKGSNQFEPDIVKSIVGDLLLSNSESIVQIQSKVIWRLSILSLSAIEPRKLAVKLIGANNLGSSSLMDLNYDLNENKICFLKWLDTWSYDGNKLKIRILFARLICLTPNNGCFTRNTFALSLHPDQVARLHLDHMEARTIDVNHVEKYFNDEERAVYVDGLGNMMPLPETENIRKSNSPFVEAFNYLEQAGLDHKHYLVEDTCNIFNDCNVNDIPTREFFTKRKELLKKYFMMAIEY